MRELRQGWETVPGKREEEITVRRPIAPEMKNATGFDLPRAARKVRPAGAHGRMVEQPLEAEHTFPWWRKGTERVSANDNQSMEA